MADETIIIEISLVDENTSARLTEIKEETARLKAEVKELNKTEAKSTEEKKKLNAALLENKAKQKALSDEMRGYEKEIVNTIKAEKEAEGSLVQLRAKLSNLTREYDNLSKAEREAAKGTELLENIKNTTDALSEAEQKSGRFQRQVGKYPQEFALAGSSMNKFQSMLNDLGLDMDIFSKGAKGGFNAIGSSLKNLGKMFLTPPIVVITVILGAIALVIKKVSDAFKKNDEASTRLQRSFAVLQPLITLIGKAFDLLATGISYVVEGISKAIIWVGKFQEALGLLPKGFSESVKAAQDLVTAVDNLEEAERRYTVNSAKNNAQIAELRVKATQDTKYSAEQRLKFLDEAIKLEKQNLESEKKIANERLRIAKAQAKQNNDTSDETMNNIAQLEAAVFQADETYNSGIRRIMSSRETFLKEIEASENERLKEAEEKQKEYIKLLEESKNKQIAIQRELQDAIFEGMQESAEKQIQLEIEMTKRRIEDIRKRLKTEENLTVQARKDLNNLIEIEQANSEKRIAEIKAAASEEAMLKLIEDEQKKIQIQLDIAKQGSEEQYTLKVAYLELERSKELEIARKNGEDVLLINEKYNDLILEAKQEQIRNEQSILQQQIDNEFKAKQIDAYNNNLKLAEIELEAARMEQEALLNIDAETKAALYENEEAYTSAILDNQQRILEAQDNVFKTQSALVQQQLNDYSAVSGAISDLFSAIAGDNEKMSGFLKILALANIAAKTAEGIAGAVAAGAGITFPGNLGAIATGISAVATGIASSKQALSQANKVKAPKFATGGLIVGAGSGTSDSILARVSNGESVMTAAATSALQPLLSSFNQIYGGAAIGTSNQVAGEDMLARAVARGVASLPNPIVSVKEIAITENRVNVLDNLSKI